MLLLRFIKILALTIILTSAFTTKADAGLYGFTHYNPYTKEERILQLSKVPQKLDNYRAKMRANLLMLIQYAKQQNADFQVITHEGQDLLTKSLWEYDREGYNRARIQENAQDDSFLFHKNFEEQEPSRYTPEYDYLNIVDAVAVNNLYCGKGHENKVAKNHNLSLITIEQCPDNETMEMARINSSLEKKASYFFVDINNAFNNIDDHININDSAQNVFKVSDAQNILIINDTSKFKNKEDFVNTLLQTNYDIIVIKPLFNNIYRYDNKDLQKLHFKKNGSKRLLIAEFNVSEAFPDNYYWHKDWKIGSPKWLIRKSFDNKDGIITQYWNPEWKQIMSRHFKDVLGEGFDGVFFTGIENYKYFERQTPLE